MNIPNILTTIRFFLIPVFIVFFYSSLDHNILYATSIFLVAGGTDVLDGYIARKYDMITKWGVVLDPLADKLMQLTVLICFTDKGYIPIWAIIIVGVKELLMISGALFLYYFNDKTVVPSNRYGKIATVIFYVAIIIVAIDVSKFLDYIVVSTAVVFTIIAFINYLVKFKVANDINNTKYIDK